MQHTKEDLKEAIYRAMEIFAEKEHYNQLRQNAFDSTIDVSDVSRAWNKEFHNITGRIYIDNDIVDAWYK